jgi:glycosyltransferase involved in cell wall biosynthesis
MMKILWFPRLQFDIDRLHITTWVEMCRQMDKSGHEVKIAVVGMDANARFQKGLIDLPVIRVKFLRIMSFWVFGFIKFIINFLKFHPDLIILDAYSIWFSFPFVFIPRRLKPLIIMDNRTPIYVAASYSISKKGSVTEARKQYNSKFGRSESSFLIKVTRFYTMIAYFYSRHFLDGITVITDYYKQQICRGFKFDPIAVGVWGSGVDTEKFDPSKFDPKKRPDFLKDKFVLMQHGEISDRRGVFETVKAVNLIEKDDICLFLLGDVVRGKLAKNNILNEIERLDRHKRVYILPQVSHEAVAEYINYCDCACMAYPDIDYWNLNNPIKLIEYLSMGKFIMCTDMWTFRDTIGDSKCAYYLKDNSPETIARAIDYCYKNRSYLSAWGRDGINIAKRKYTWEKQAQRLIDFSQRLKNLKEKR